MTLRKVNQQRPWIVATVAGSALRLGWWTYARPAPVSDFEYYRRAGLELLAHGQLGFPQPSAERVPGYPALMAGLLSISQSIAWLSLVNVLLSTLLIPLVYRLALAATSKPRLAWLAALLCAVNPTFVLLSPVLASEHLYAPLLVGCLICLAPMGNESFRPLSRNVGAGLLYGAAVLTRPDALFYVPLVGGLAAWFPGSITGRVKAAVVVLGCAALVVTPWYVRNRVVFGPGIGLTSIGGLNFYYAHNDHQIGYHDLAGTPLQGLNEVERQRRGYEMGLEYLATVGPRRLMGDVISATRVLYWSVDAASLHWSTRAAGPTPDDSGEKPLRGLAWLRSYEAYGYHALLVLACGSLLVAGAYGTRFWWLTGGFVVLTWVGDAVILSSMARHRYATEAIFCIMAAALLSSGDALEVTTDQTAGTTRTASAPSRE